MKKKVIEQLVLTLLDFSKVFQVDYDANRSTIGAVLSQEGIPITFFSEKLNEAKNKYSMHAFQAAAKSTSFAYNSFTHSKPTTSIDKVFNNTIL